MKYAILYTEVDYTGPIFGKSLISFFLSNLYVIIVCSDNNTSKKNAENPCRNSHFTWNSCQIYHKNENPRTFSSYFRKIEAFPMTIFILDVRKLILGHKTITNWYYFEFRSIFNTFLHPAKG